jgi:hypothetical protein
VTAGTTDTVSPLTAAATQARSDPAPESFPLVTVQPAA